MSGDRFYTWTLSALGALVVVLHLLGAGPLRDSFWGVHLYAFFPRATLVIATGVLMLVGIRSLRARGAPPAAATTAHEVELDTPRWRTMLGVALASIIAALAFWWLRERHTFLGDGDPLASAVAEGYRFSPREPLTALLQHVIHLLARGLFSTPGRESFAVARDTVALGSVVAGACFVPVAWGLSSELIAWRSATRCDLAPASNLTRVLLAAVMLGQGYSQLFFGYVESYTFLLLGLGFYLWSALRYLRGRSSLLLPAAALIVSLALHLSAGVMIPSFLLLAAWALARPDLRRAAARDLLISAALLAALSFGLGTLEHGYNFLSTFIEVGRTAVSGREEHAPGYLGSALHLRDFFNEQMLIGPLALLLFIPAAVRAATARVGRQLPGLFLALAGLSALGACWVAGDSNLGYARNWDLLAPMGLIFSTAALFSFLSDPMPAFRADRLLGFALALSLYHTVPWVGVNASLERSLERVKTLPLGLGRTEVMLGTWYGRQGDVPQAERWFARALEVNPANSTAHYFFGLLLMQQGEPERAAQAFHFAVSLRPFKPDYRVGLVDALVRSRHPDQALPQTDTLLTLGPREARFWAMRGMVLMQLDQRAEAASALAKATNLSPGNALYSRFAAAARRADGFTIALQADWDEIVRP